MKTLLTPETIKALNLPEVQTGDTFLVKSDSFLSRVICKVMLFWARKKGYPQSKVYSHAARFIWIAGELYLFGSVENGYNPILFKKHYDLSKNQYAIMRRKVKLSEADKMLTTNYCLHLDSISVMYQYWNFFQWLLLVYLNINTFKEDSDRFNYCYESEARCREQLNPSNYRNTYQTDVFQLLYDPYYEIIYENA
jgi:hypothetical protein